jgi:hypothetical protein
MFKKLKQKIEEGGESGIDKVAFSPRKLPGSVVRSSSQIEEPQATSSPSSAPTPQTSADSNLQPPSPATTAVQESPRRESRDEDQGITIESVTAPSVVRGSEQVHVHDCGFIITDNYRDSPNPCRYPRSCMFLIT